MPYLRVGEGAEAVNVYYEVHGQHWWVPLCPHTFSNLMLLGFFWKVVQLADEEWLKGVVLKAVRTRMTGPG